MVQEDINHRGCGEVVPGAESFLSEGVTWAPDMAQQSKALHLSARGVTTDPGSIPACIINAQSSGLGFGRDRPFKK